MAGGIKDGQIVDDKGRPLASVLIGFRVRIFDEQDQLISEASLERTELEGLEVRIDPETGQPVLDVIGSNTIETNSQNNPPEGPESPSRGKETER